MKSSLWGAVYCFRDFIPVLMEAYTCRCNLQYTCLDKDVNNGLKGALFFQR